MLAKTTVLPVDWDRQLPFVLYAYNTTPHDSTGESPFFILHGTDPVFPFVPEMNQNIPYYLFDLDDFRCELMMGLYEIRKNVLSNLKNAQERMKRYWDARNHAKADVFKEGDRVLVFVPNAKSKSHHPKFIAEYAGEYRIKSLSQNSAEVYLIGKNEPSFKVQIDHLRKIPPEVKENDMCLGASKRRKWLKKQKEVVRERTLSKKVSKIGTKSVICFRQQCKVPIQFGTNEALREGIDIAASICDPNVACTKKYCTPGLSFGEGFRAVPAELKTIRFSNVEDLAKAIHFVCDSSYTKEQKILQISGHPYQIVALPTCQDYVYVFSPFMSFCRHRISFLEQSFGYPLFRGH